MTTMSAPSSALPGRDVLTYFAVFVLLAGGAPVAMRIGYSELQPFWLGFTRFGLGAAIFWLLVLGRRVPLPRGRALTGALLYGALGVGVSFILLAWGLVKTPANLTAILLALVPLITVVLASLQGAESLTTRRLLGALLAVAGIAVNVGGAPRGDISIPHVGAILLGTFFLAQSGVIIKIFPPNPPVMTNAVSMTIGALMLGVASLVVRETWVIPSQPGTWAALGYLVVLVSVVAFLSYLRVLQKWSASGASYAFVLTPLVTVVVAAMLTGEQIGPAFAIGALLVLAGVFIGALLPERMKHGDPHSADMNEDCKDSAGQVAARCL